MGRQTQLIVTRQDSCCHACVKDRLTINVREEDASSSSPKRLQLVFAISEALSSQDNRQNYLSLIRTFGRVQSPFKETQTEPKGDYKQKKALKRKKDEQYSQ